MNILLADDHGLFRDSMCIWLRQLDVEVHIQQACTFHEVVSEIKSNNALQLVLLDLYMPSMQGPASVHHICQLLQNTPVAVMSADENPDIIKRCIQAGAVGYLPKASSGQVILAAIQVILSGGSYLPADMLKNEQIAPLLSNKQHQILILLAEGFANKEIAYQANLAEGTVKQYVSEILKKLGVHNRTQAGVKAQELGLFRK